MPRLRRLDKDFHAKYYVKQTEIIADPESHSTDGFTGSGKGASTFQFRHEDLVIRSVDEARNRFLRAILSKAPQVLTDLADKVFPLFRATWLSLDQSSEISKPAYIFYMDQWFFRETWKEEGGDYPVEIQNQVKELIATLDEWAERWNLHCGWVLDAATNALNALAAKLNFDSLAAEMNLNRHFEENTLEENWKLYPEYRWPSGPNFLFEFPAWDMASDTWKSYKDKITKAFFYRLGYYALRKQRNAQLEKRSRAKQTHAEAHFIWLVEHQINRKSIAQIAREYGPSSAGGLDRKTISGAVRSLSSFIELPGRVRKE